MILGVDHIALSCTDVDAAAGALDAIGFRTKFISHDVRNDPSKRGMLNRYEQIHSVAYCQAARGVAVELTMHGPEVRPVLSPYQLMFDAPSGTFGPPGGAIPPGVGEVWRDAFGIDVLSLVVIETAGAQSWTSGCREDTEDCKGPGASIRAVMIPALDVEASAAFWTKALGFRRGESGRTRDGAEWVRVSAVSPVPAWSLDAVVASVSGYPAGKPMLDDAGFPCVALLSTDIRRDSDTLAVNGASEMTDVFSIEVGGKGLEVALFRGPAGELVELVQVARGV